MPERVRVQWTDAAGRERSAVVELGEVLKQSAGGAGETLLFEIGPAGAVGKAYVSSPR